ncbi:MAG: hypothetical protein ACQEQF_04975 [Bacillota bacterium]
MRKPIIKESESGIWKQAFCPICDTQLSFITADRKLICNNNEHTYEISKDKINWNNVEE